MFWLCTALLCRADVCDATNVLSPFIVAGIGLTGQALMVSCGDAALWMPIQPQVPCEEEGCYTGRPCDKDATQSNVSLVVIEVCTVCIGALCSV